MSQERYWVIIAVLIGIFFASGEASAENSLKTGSKALSFGIAAGDMEVAGRYFIMDDLAVLLGFGFEFRDNSESESDYAVSGGVRKYLSKTDLAPFIGAGLSYRSEEHTVETGPGKTKVEDENTFTIDGHFGAEYFLAKLVSAEAQVGFGLSDTSNGADVTTIGTFRSGVRVNIYFP